MKKIVVIVLGLALVLAAGFYTFRNDPAKSPNSSDKKNTNSSFNKQQYSLSDPSSLWIIANKSRPLDPSYVPNDLIDVSVAKHGQKSQQELQLRFEAAKSLERLFATAKAEGVDLAEGSGYRSYQLQKFYYENYVAQSGQAEADRFSARPGTSEHQTGWATDLSAVNGKCYLEECFGETPEGQWIASNAYKYGFILRYPKGKEEITGYQYEPWHLRYVGEALANELHKTEQTLEEYFGLN